MQITNFMVMNYLLPSKCYRELIILMIDRSIVVYECTGNSINKMHYNNYCYFL